MIALAPPRRDYIRAAGRQVRPFTETLLLRSELRIAPFMPCDAYISRSARDHYRHPAYRRKRLAALRTESHGCLRRAASPHPHRAPVGEVEASLLAIGRSPMQKRGTTTSDVKRSREAARLSAHAPRLFRPRRRCGRFHANAQAGCHTIRGARCRVHGRQAVPRSPRYPSTSFERAPKCRLRLRSEELHSPMFRVTVPVSEFKFRLLSAQIPELDTPGLRDPVTHPVDHHERSVTIEPLERVF